jgi:hypothetical protein
MNTEKDRRRRPRMKFREPIRADVGEARVAILDASAVGLGVAHESPLPPPGRICRVNLQSELGPIQLDCAIVRTVTRSSLANRIIFQTGLEVLSADRQSAARLASISEMRAPKK